MKRWLREQKRFLRGSTSPVVVVLLAGILVALIGLIIVMTTQGRSEPTDSGPDRSQPSVAAGQTVHRSELPDPPPRPEPVGNPNRIRETLQEGKTYHAVVKFGLESRAEDRAWGLKEVIAVAYAAEMVVERKIEVNDGHRIVERRHFVTSRNVKLLCDVEDLSLDLGLPGTLLLGALEYVQPGSTAVLATAQPLVQGILSSASQSQANAAAVKAVAHVDSLSGKSVKITYVDDIGVEAIEPIGCSLSAEERDFVFNTAILSDCYILPDVAIKTGQSWTVDGAQLAGFLDPSMRGRPSGEVVIARGPDTTENDKAYGHLEIQSGVVLVNASDDSTRRVGSFEPQGSLRYDITDGFVDRASLTGRFQFEEVSTDHLLFETSFRTRPTLQIEYSCTIR